MRAGTNQVDALGRMTKYEFDAFGRRLRRILPGAQAETFGFDAVGNMIAHTNFNGLVITNRYDSMNRLLSRHVGTNGAVLESYAYTPNGLRSTRADESGSYAWNYDSRDRVIAAFGAVGTLHYAYDQAGNLTNLQSSTINGVWLNYEYDALNRVTNVIDKRLTGTNNTRYGFDAIGNLIALAYPNGVTNLWQYDARNRLTNEVWKLNTSTLASFVYQLGIAGNRTNLSETVNGAARNYDWAYDALYRLTNEVISGSAPTGTVRYRYDLIGNRTNRASTDSGVTNQAFSYTTNDWLTTDSYDPNGNTTNSAGASYLYDYANRLTNFVNETTSVSIVYDGDGNRVSKTVDGVTTLFLVDVQNLTGYAQVLEELAVSGGATNLARVYTYGLDLISQRHGDGAVQFYGYDGLGSVRFLVTTNGTTSDAYAYDAYGALIESPGTNYNVYLFAGEQQDVHLGFYYKRARYLSVATGRFWTMDSFEGDQSDPLSLHKYAFCHSDPVNRIDPSGHESGTLVEKLGVSGIIGITAALYLGVVAEQKTHALQNLGTAAGEAAGELLDEASIAAQNAIAAAEAAILSANYTSLSDAVVKAKEQLRTAGNRLKILKVVPISKTMMRDVADHVQAAQASGQPAILQRVSSAQAKVNRRDALRGRGRAGSGKSWDEYSFASGRVPGSRSPSVKAVPRGQNLIQGGVIAAAYKLEKINVGDRYFVVVIP